MDNKVIEQILEKGGMISWQSKYFLDFIDSWNVNPDLSWEGYEIYTNEKVIYRSTHIDEVLDYLDDLIYSETRNNNY